MFAIVLVHPEIPPNTGNVIRLDREHRRRAAPGRAARLPRSTTASSSAPASTTTSTRACTCIATSPRAAPRWTRRRRGAGSRSRRRRRASLHDVAFAPGRRAGVRLRDLGPARRACSTTFAPRARLRIPMRPGVRSLNLSNAVAVAVYEAWRQNGFRLTRLVSARRPWARAAAAPRPRRAPGPRRRGRCATASVIGISMPWCAASARAARAACDAFGDVAERGEDRVERLARARARARRCRLRDSVAGAGQHEVAQAREPHQRLAPPAHRRPTRRAISASPRVISAARALWPKPRPSASAGRDREHVLDRAADLDAGDVVGLVDAQRVAAQQRRGLRARATASVAAATSAVGSPRATSPAKLGPDTTPTGAGQRGAIAGARASRRRPARRGATKPFDSQTSGARTPASQQRVRERVERARSASRRSTSSARAPRARSPVDRERVAAARRRAGSARCARSRAQLVGALARARARARRAASRARACARWHGDRRAPRAGADDRDFGARGGHGDR